MNELPTTADNSTRIQRGTKAIITMAAAAAISVAILSVVTLIRGQEVVDAILNPVFLVGAGVVSVLTGLATLDGNAGNAGDDDGDGDEPRSPWVLVAGACGGVAAVAVVIGVLIAVVTDASLTAVLINRRFLIPVGIAIVVTGLKAWPDDEEPPE